jgi:predicted GIY-YIG superfamily endonuclease
MKQPCARWGCENTATYEKPLCYEHWQEFDELLLMECSRCHWFYDGGDFVLSDTSGDLYDDYPFMCDSCLSLTLVEEGKRDPWPGREVERRPVASHADIRLPRRYIYILKLSDASFYVGQTTDLPIRIQEHRDGHQRQTRGKDPKLVFFTAYEGMRDEVNETERELIRANQTGAGHRRIRKLIEEFRSQLRLIDLEA